MGRNREKLNDPEFVQHFKSQLPPFEGEVGGPFWDFVTEFAMGVTLRHILEKTRQGQKIDPVEIGRYLFFFGVLFYDTALEAYDDWIAKCLLGEVGDGLITE